MACLNYLSLDIFLIYFDHSNLIPCVSMDPLTKNHVESWDFPYGFCIILVRHVGIVMAYLNYLSLDIFLRYFDNSNMNPCVSMDSFTKTMWKLANFHIDFA
jgi:hypothetical protein